MRGPGRFRLQILSLSSVGSDEKSAKESIVNSTGPKCAIYMLLPVGRSEVVLRMRAREVPDLETEKFMII